MMHRHSPARWGQTPTGLTPTGLTPTGLTPTTLTPTMRTMRTLLRGAMALAIIVAPGLGAQSAPVRTHSGLVTGTAAKLPGVRAYLGIPFAAPPVGDLRWRAPQPVAAWKGTRAADHFSPSCIQGPNTPFGPWTAEFLLLGPTSEDCLYVNVWTKAAANARRPV